MKKKYTVIKLDEHFTIEADPYAWLLREQQEKTKIVKGKEKPIKSKNVTCHSNITQALKKYIDVSLKHLERPEEYFTVLMKCMSTIERTFNIELPMDWKEYFKSIPKKHEK